MANIYSDMGRFLQEAVNIDDTFKKPIKTTLKSKVNKSLNEAFEGFNDRLQRARDAYDSGDPYELQDEAESLYNFLEENELELSEEEYDELYGWYEELENAASSAWENEDLDESLNEAIDPAKRDFINRMYRKPFYAITDECFWLDEDGNTHDVPREWLEEWFDRCLERLYGDKHEAPINEDYEFDPEERKVVDFIVKNKKYTMDYSDMSDEEVINDLKMYDIYGLKNIAKRIRDNKSLNESINNFKDPIKLKVQIKAGPKVEASTLRPSWLDKYYAKLFNEFANQPIKPEILVDNQDGSGEICFPGRDDLIDIIKSQFEKKHEFFVVEID